MKKLRIAVTADTMPEISHVTNIIRAPFSPRQLVGVIAELDAIPVVFPDVTGACGEDYVELFDGLIIPGGPDIDPRFLALSDLWRHDAGQLPPPPGRPRDRQGTYGNSLCTRRCH